MRQSHDAQLASDSRKYEAELASERRRYQTLEVGPKSVLRARMEGLTCPMRCASKGTDSSSRL